MSILVSGRALGMLLLCQRRADGVRLSRARRASCGRGILLKKKTPRIKEKQVGDAINCTIQLGKVEGSNFGGGRRPF